MGGADYESADLYLPSSYADLRAVWDANPATTTSWTPTTVNASEFGIKLQS